MPVRLRITFLFAIIVLAILTLVCGLVYYFSYESRIRNITSRLTNRAVTASKMLNQSETFDRSLMQKIDSSTMLSLLNKTVQAYDSLGRRIYTYSDLPGDTLAVDKKIMDNAKEKSRIYFTIAKKDVIAWHGVPNDKGITVVVAAIDMDGTERIQQLRLILLISFVAGLVIAIAGGYFFSAGLLRPIRKIADEVNEISAQSLARRINSGHSKDEWNYLASTLNQLLNRLQDSFEVQRRFISNASHELLTPLTSMSSQLEVSLQRGRPAGEYRDVMLSIYQDVRHLSKLTRTLLEFAKASGTPGGIEIDLVRIDEILLRLPGEIVKTNSENSVSLILNGLPPEEEKLLVFGNEELLFIAIKNIVINSCKYSGDHKARVELDIRKNEIKISISDKGPGIPTEELDNIFHPFYRISNDSDVAGFGLGLSLTSRIISLHKGNIIVNSAIGEGTTFVIGLPVAGSKGGL